MGVGVADEALAASVVGNCACRGLGRGAGGLCRTDADACGGFTRPGRAVRGAVADARCTARARGGRNDRGHDGDRRHHRLVRDPADPQHVAVVGGAVGTDRDSTSCAVANSAHHLPRLARCCRHLATRCGGVRDAAGAGLHRLLAAGNADGRSDLPSRAPHAADSACALRARARISGVVVRAVGRRCAAWHCVCPRAPRSAWRGQRAVAGVGRRCGMVDRVEPARQHHRTLGVACAVRESAAAGVDCGGHADRTRRHRGHAGAGGGDRG